MYFRTFSELIPTHFSKPCIRSSGFLKVVRLNAFRAHLWKTIGIGSAARTKEGFDKAFNMAFPQAGTQGESLDIFDA
jgi:hypothetical protein